MRRIISLLIVLLLPCPAFAYTDSGLLNKDKTLSYFLLSPIESTDLSSGLVYNQKQNENLKLEVSMTAYKSVYLLTKNVTKIRINEKYKFIQFGPLSLTGLGGMAVYYAPSVGVGLAADVGGIAALKILENLACSLCMNGIIFRDGLEVGIEPTLSFVPGFIKNLEVYGGGRVEGSLVGFATDGSQGGKFSIYAHFGARMGL